MTRNKTSQAKLEAVSQRLRDMFQAVEAMPIPDRLMSVIDQLDDSDSAAIPAPQAVRARRARSG